jgi:pimeloyl-ACP methyl ester carboxylesterase
LRLAVIERPVPESKGVIVFNPGGPGESGVLILPILASFVPTSVLSQFTLVSFDERGTGSSNPLLCGPSPSAASSAVAGTVAAAHTFSGLDRSCRSRYPKLFPTVNTTTSARDMNRLRLALGVDRINYYGLSYGTVLGSIYRQLFPSHLRSMVLDGAVDANLSLPTDATLEAPAIQTALEHALSNCPATPGCALGSNPNTVQLSHSGVV